MGYRLSTFDPSKPEITKANIMSQFPQDTIKVPLPEMTHSEKLEKAEFDAKERKDLVKKKEAQSDGSFPIRNQKDLENAIHDVGRSKNPAKAKAWIKKRAKDLDCEDCLPGSWQKATEDELNMFNDKLEKGEKKKVKKSTNESNVLSEKPEREAHNYDKKVLKTPANKTVANDKPTKVKKSIKKDMDGDGGGDEMEQSVNKAFDSIFGEDDSDPIEKSFEKLMGVETDPIERAFSDVLRKGGPGSGKKIGMTRSGKKVYSDKYPHEYSDFSADDHTEAGTIHERAATKSKNDNKFRHHMGMDHSHSMLARKMRETIN